VRQGSFTPRGVRNPAARNYLSAMRVGDEVLFYHSQQELAVFGVMTVTREAYPDPTSTDSQWLTCDFAPVKTLAYPLPLEDIKADLRLAGMALIHQPRLAVMPVTAAEFQIIAEDVKA
jgi:predicted RNA-binding protein with PUA-like domain